jgi:hypothetical protein
MSECECIEAGWCARYNKQMAGRIQQICRGERIEPDLQAKYLRKWEVEATGQEYACRKAKPAEILKGAIEQDIARGPGTELKKLLRSYGVRPSAGCKCNARAREMDERGVEWCRQNIATIIGWLKEEADKGIVGRLAWSERRAQWFVVTAIRRAKIQTLLANAP